MEPHLEHLATATGPLRAEPMDPDEFEVLKQRGKSRLHDAANASLALDSRFDLAYGAAHSLSLAALRHAGFRPRNQRYIVFQVLPHTLGLGPEVWRVLSKCHEVRNLAEYEGSPDINERLVADLIQACNVVAAAVDRLTDAAG